MSTFPFTPICQSLGEINLYHPAFNRSILTDTKNLIYIPISLYAHPNKWKP